MYVKPIYSFNNSLLRSYHGAIQSAHLSVYPLWRVFLLSVCTECAIPQGRYKSATNPEQQRNKQKSLISLIPHKIIQLYSNTEYGTRHRGRGSKGNNLFLSLQNDRAATQWKLIMNCHTRTDRQAALFKRRLPCCLVTKRIVQQCAI